MTGQEYFSQKVEYWSALRAVIVHEDNLVHQRFTSLLQFETIAIGGFFVAENAAMGNGAIGVIWATQAFFLALMALGIWLCYVSGTTISSAYRHIQSIDEAWRRRYTEEADWEAVHVPRWMPSLVYSNWAYSIKQSSDKPQPRQNFHFAPIRGVFTNSPTSYTQRLPFLMLALNVVVGIFCLIIGLSAWLCPGALHGSSDKSSVTIEKQVIQTNPR